MRAKSTPSCRMDVQFHSTPDGRPEIYDFLWDHLPSMLEELGQKKVHASIALPTTKKSSKKDIARARMVEHFLHKLARDSRFSDKKKSHAAPLTHFDATIPVSRLESLLNGYNVLLEAALPHTRMETPEVTIDFSPATQHAIHIHTLAKHAPAIQTFLAQHMQAAPRVRMITFTEPHPLQRALTKGGH